MMEDDIIKDDELDPELPIDEVDLKKKHLLDDEDVLSSDDIAEEEDLEEVESFDDENPI